MNLEKSEVCLLVIDVQDKLFPHIERPCETMHAMQKIVKGFQILKLPIIVSEQYPEGLGKTILGLENLFSEGVKSFSKTTFSAVRNKELHDALMPFQQFVLIGLETHICVLQTAKDLLKLKKDVVVLNDATQSRSIYDFSTAIAELTRDGVRISSVETVLFELLQDAKSPEFKSISQLVKE